MEIRKEELKQFLSNKVKEGYKILHLSGDRCHEKINSGNGFAIYAEYGSVYGKFGKGLIKYVPFLNNEELYNDHKEWFDNIEGAFDKMVEIAMEAQEGDRVECTFGTVFVIK